MTYFESAEGETVSKERALQENCPGIAFPKQISKNSLATWA